MVIYYQWYVPRFSIRILIFGMYINLTELGIASNILKFADDTKLVCKVGNEERYEQLRADLRKFYQWSVNLQMLFNLEKCKIMHFGYNNLQNTLFLIRGHILDTAVEERDLGIIVRNDFKVSSQCLEVVKTANQVLGMRKRTFSYKTIDNLLPLSHL